MSLKKQWNKIKENWLIIVLLLILVFILVPLVLGFVSVNKGVNSISDMSTKNIGASSYSMQNSYDSAIRYETDFAPEIDERKITKASNIESKTEDGKFNYTEILLKDIIKNKKGIILSENIKTINKGERNEYKIGNYEIKVPTENYDNFLDDIKDIFEIENINNSQTDITGEYEDLEIELNVETKKLERYQEMYENADEVEDQIKLNDRIFSQERRIKYLKERIEQKDQKINYSTINLRMVEEVSKFSSIEFVKGSSLVASLVGSINFLLKLLAVIIPFIIIIYLIVMLVRHKKRKKHKRR